MVWERKQCKETVSFRLRSARGAPHTPLRRRTKNSLDTVSRQRRGWCKRLSTRGCDSLSAGSRPVPLIQLAAVYRFLIGKSQVRVLPGPLFSKCLLSFSRAGRFDSVIPSYPARSAGPPGPSLNTSSARSAVRLWHGVSTSSPSLVCTARPVWADGRGLSGHGESPGVRFLGSPVS